MRPGKLSQMVICKEYKSVFLSLNIMAVVYL